MPFSYPTNYYGLRRVLSERIREKMESYEPGSKDRDELMLELRIFARDLSNESGATIKLVYALFEQRGIILEVRS